MAQAVHRAAAAASRTPKVPSRVALFAEPAARPVVDPVVRLAAAAEPLSRQTSAFARVRAYARGSTNACQKQEDGERRLCGRALCAYD